MRADYYPTTEVELENWMKQNCFNFNDYSINGNHIHEGCGIDREGEGFVWYFTERGKKSQLKHFSTEREIIEYAFNQIQNDKWARTHCIGFVDTESEHKQLERILQGMELKYYQDQIPYYISGEQVYRTFVFGCDIHKTVHLKESFYKVK